MSKDSPDLRIRDLSWDGVQLHLREIHNEIPDYVKSGIIVGGAACLYYRTKLENTGHEEFPPRQYTEDEERLWLSHDIDFAILPDMEFPSIKGLRVGRVQMGFRIFPDMFNDNANLLEIDYKDGLVLQVKIADSIDLYLEKQACVGRRNQKHDKLHFDMLTELVIFQICRALEAPHSVRVDEFLNRAKQYCPELFGDRRIQKRS